VGVTFSGGVSYTSNSAASVGNVVYTVTAAGPSDNFTLYPQ
jgi:hypothetical protein